MVQFANFTDEEREIVMEIVDRAVKAGIYDDPLTADMDISAVCVHCPLYTRRVPCVKRCFAPSVAWRRDRRGRCNDQPSPRCCDQGVPCAR